MVHHCRLATKPSASSCLLTRISMCFSQVVKTTADIFLDTFSFNAHSTLADALHASLPFLTLPGQKQASRVAAGIAAGAGLSFMIARCVTLDDRTGGMVTYFVREGDTG